MRAAPWGHRGAGAAGQIVGGKGCVMATAGPWRACAALACGWVRAEGFGAVRAQKGHRMGQCQSVKPAGGLIQ